MNFKWEHCGYLGDDQKQKPWKHGDEKGVYLWVFQGKPHRIIYVGTAGFKKSESVAINTSFAKRWKAGTKEGEYFVFRASKDDDVYKIMSRNLRDEKECYRQLQIDGKLWIPGCYDNRPGNWNCWKGNQHFLSNITLWIHPLNDNQGNKVLLLESNLQWALSQKFKIGYYTRGQGIHGDQSWLGHPEVQHTEDWQDQLNIIVPELKECFAPIQ